MVDIVDSKPLKEKDIEKPLKISERGLANVNKGVAAKEQSKTSDVAFAAFDEDNTVFNVVKQALTPNVIETEPKDPNYNPFTKNDKDQDILAGYEERLEEFIGAESDGDVERIKLNIDFHKEQQEILENASTFDRTVATIAAGTLDPLFMLPVVKSIKLASKSAQVVSGIGQGAAITGLSEVARETFLQSSQEFRSTERSLGNVAAAAIFGGIFGGIVGGVAQSTKSAARKIIEKDLADQNIQIDISGPTPKVVRSDDGVGAGKVRDTDFTDDELAGINRGLALAISGPKIIQNPVFRGLTSKSPTINALTQALFLNNYATRKTLKGKATDFIAQNHYMRDMDELAQVTKSNQKIYKSLRQESNVKVPDVDKKVARVLATGKVDDLVGVNSIAKALRPLLDIKQKELLEMGMIKPEDIVENYLPQIWNVNYIHTVEGGQRFLDKFGDILQRQNIDGTLVKGVKSVSDADSEALGLLTQLRGEQDTQLAFESLVGQRMRSTGKEVTEERKINLNYEDIEEFLETDVNYIMSNYINKSSGYINTEKALRNITGESKLGDMSSLKNQILDERDEAIRAATDPKVKESIMKDFEEASELGDLLYRTSTGSLLKRGSLDKHFANLRIAQYVRLLGSVFVSTLVELGMPLMRFGIKEFGAGYMAAIRNPKAFKATTEELSDMHVGTNLINNNLLRFLGGADNTESRNLSKWERNVDRFVKGFTQSTGINQITQYGRVLSGHMAQSSVVRTLRRGATEKETQQLAKAGLSKDMQSKVLAELNKHAEEVDGSFLSNPHLWEDQVAAEAYTNTVRQLIDSTIVTPGRGDIPFKFQESELGKTIFQFKGFMSAATGKVTTAAIQDRDGRTAVGLLALLGMGMLSQKTADALSGKDVKRSEAEWIEVGMSRSGMLGLLGTTLLDAGRTYTNPKTRRFGTDFASLLGGPSAGFINDLSDLTGKLSDGNVSDSDLRAAGRLLPLQNHAILKALLLAMEK